jgi:uncharacterized protein YndB with AHSA1/START domain
MLGRAGVAYGAKFGLGDECNDGRRVVASQHRVTAVTTIPASLERVWTIVSDMSGYADWIESTIEVIRADPEIALGAHYEERTRLSGFWTAATTWTVTDCQPNERISFVADGAAAVRSLALELTLRELKEGTEVATTYSYSLRFGPLGTLLELIVRSNVVADQRRSLRTLSYLAEQVDDAVD